MPVTAIKTLNGLKGIMVRIIQIILILGLTLFTLSGCSDPKPLNIGFIGGTSGKVTDLGVPGRNGVMLAVENRNKQGGVKGRHIELLLKDDRQDGDLAKRAATELIASDVAAILGPMTSSMALEVIPVTQQSDTLTMGITVTTNELTGKDDVFFRTLSPTLDHASEIAKYLRAKKDSERITIVYDLKNKSYTESWVGDFSAAFRARGGEIVQINSFFSNDQVMFSDIAEDALSENPAWVVMVVNSVDAALLAKQLRTMNPDIQLAASEWAGTERLIELGGRYVEGIVVPQYFDRDSLNPEYQAFYNAYFDRFGHSPGFPGLIGFNAANVVLDGLAAKQDDESLKQAILRIGTFSVIPGKITFDSFGDTKSKTYLTEVIDGQFRLGTSL